MFKDKLKLLREEHQLSQTELASIIYVSRSAVAKWEQGRGMPSEESLHELCKVFHVTEKELLNKKEQKIYTFDYKKEKIFKTIIISLLILTFLLVIGIIVIIDYNKPDVVDITNIYPGNINVISIEMNEEYEININGLDIDERYNQIEITNKNSDYTIKKGKIKFLKTGIIDVYGKALINEGNTIIKIYEGILLKVYCYDKTKLKEINTIDDFINISNDLDGLYILNNNLDFSDYKAFTSIGNNGIFNGMIINPNNYRISNISMESSNNSDMSCGIFHKLHNAYIDNLKIDNIYINSTNEQKYVGAIAGIAKESYISNCSISGIVNGRMIVGGIVGYIENCRLINCSFAGEVHQKNISGREYIDNCAGGLFGIYNYNISLTDLKIEDNIIVGTVSSDNIAGKVGGIIYDKYNEYNDKNKTLCTLKGVIKEKIALIR